LEILLISVFSLGYFFIAFEHNFKIDKAATALITGVLTWTILVSFSDYKIIDKELAHHLVDIGEIVFFLLGAMTIVELVDSHQGFKLITDKIKTTNAVKLLWILSTITFFFSAVLDNLTTAIVMAALLQKLIKSREQLLFFAGIMILAANAGGAWSPIGDITTIMLWVGGQISLNIIPAIIIPSVVCIVMPLIYISFKYRGKNIERPTNVKEEKTYDVIPYERNIIFTLGVLGLLFVPVFKTITHLPPYMGMLLSLGILWIVTEIIHKGKDQVNKHSLTVPGALSKIEASTVFFFLGILLAVGSLQSGGILNSLATILDDVIGNIYLINIFIGFLSAILDNVPLVAGAMGMYEITSIGDYAMDGIFWEFLAYCAGTGGSLLVIGSAAGVAVMGILRINFIWYLRKISFLALIGYLSGAAVYILL
jgi:Na+/H+ antiporter NhaD/arsenite permease-like protein|tara:strand:- start:1940 stop:3211 length:1272 start_codon:yes stop_codon:yes gene_type:complete